MFHAHIISFFTCFTCILLHLFTFSWTNLLTRCPVPVSCFLLFFISENLHRKYSRNCTGRKPPCIYCCHVHGDRRRDRGGCGAPTPPGGAGPTPGMRRGGVGPTGLPRGQPFAHIYLFNRNPKYPIRIPRKVPSPPSSSTLDREDSRALPSTLPEGRSSPEGSTSPCLPPV